jgi:hypothetical protein
MTVGFAGSMTITWGLCWTTLISGPDFSVPAL